MDRFMALETFLLVIEEESFAGAARRLGKSRSQVSRVVAQLEDRLGVQLISRSTRTVVPTSAGQAFFGRIRAILDELTDAEAELTAQHVTAKGKLRVNTPSSIPGVNFSEAIVAFMRRYPAVEIELTMENRMIDPLRDGYDLVVRIAEPDEEADLVDHRILALDYGLYCSADYLAARGAPTAPADLQNHDTLALAQGDAAPRWSITGPDGEATVRIKPRLVSNHRETLYEGVRSGLGVAIMPAFAMAALVAEGSVVRVMPEHHCGRVMLQVIYAPSRHLSTKVRLLTDFLSERFAARLS